MELIFRFCLFIVGVINFLPSLAAILPSKIPESYGIVVPDVNYELLLRHRGVLFGLIGGLMIFSALRKKYYSLSTLLGMISMISFILLFLLVGKGLSEELRMVMRVDAGGIVVLGLGFILYRYQLKKSVNGSDTTKN